MEELVSGREAARRLGIANIHNLFARWDSRPPVQQRVGTVDLFRYADVVEWYEAERAKRSGQTHAQVSGSVNDVRCTACGAHIGAGCVTPSGHPANEPHMARVRAYWKAQG